MTRNLILGAVALLFCCKPADVLVGTLPIASGGSGGSQQGAGGSSNGGTGGSQHHPGGSHMGGSGASASCKENTDCGANAYCEKNACADTTGQCKPRPLSCDNHEEPVCGCDGTSFWNPCLRELYGESEKAIGPCVVQDNCEGPSSSPCSVDGAYCTKLIPPGAQCNPTPPSSCWVLPSSCPTTSPSEWSPCGPPGPAPCVSVCDALKAQVPYHFEPGPMCGGP